MEADGISLNTFLKHVVVYYKVVKGIAFTDAADISKCSTIRKAEEGEVVEVLDGPVESSDGLNRIKAKSVTKEDKTEGWITVSGSKGTVFAIKCEKPAEKPNPK